MWHPAALDAFDDYFGSVSHFTNTVDDTWTTQITLTHWALQKTQLLIKYNEARKEGSFPPMDVQNLVLQVKQTEEKVEPKMRTSAFTNTDNLLSGASQIVREYSSTLVITGDARGRFWVCSAWSALLEEEKMSAHAQKITRILQLFIHKPSTGRSLVFLFLLGFICENLADEYKKIVDSMDNIILEVRPSSFP